MSTCDGKVRHHLAEGYLRNMENVRACQVKKFREVEAYHHGICDSPNEDIPKEESNGT